MLEPYWHPMLQHKSILSISAGEQIHALGNIVARRRGVSNAACPSGVEDANLVVSPTVDAMAIEYCRPDCKTKGSPDEITSSSTRMRDENIDKTAHRDLIDSQWFSRAVQDFQKVKYRN